MHSQGAVAPDDDFPALEALQLDEPIPYALTPRGHLRAATSEPRWLRIAIAEGLLMLPPSCFFPAAGGGR